MYKIKHRTLPKSVRIALSEITKDAKEIQQDGGIEELGVTIDNSTPIAWIGYNTIFGYQDRTCYHSPEYKIAMQLFMKVHSYK